MRPEYIDLNRTFLDFDEDSDIEGAAYKSYLASLSGGTDWQALLQSKYVVVLGEQGSGKTWELEAKAENLRKTGQHAFFMRIDVLATGAFEAAIDATELESFGKWQNSALEATFFLDSVDEAKLRDPKAFRDALNVFLRGIGSAVIRARVVVSCRYYEWRTSTDREEFMRRFSIPGGVAKRRQSCQTETSETPPLLRIVQFAPLDAARIKTLAMHRNVPDPDGFMTAIVNHNLWDFAGRPKDVDNLITYWCKHRRFGTRTEMIEYDISHKLKECLDRENADPLTGDKAKQGAQILAAAVIFSRQFNFIVPDDPIDPNLAADSLTPSEALPPDWTPKQMHALLDRAIFDVALYGRVRFHHRSITEYLAASWLSERLKNNCPFAEIESLLFRRCHGRDVVIPSRAPLTAWLSVGDDIQHQRIRDKVLRYKPELLLQHGDPEKLPQDTRKELLKALVDRYAGRDSIRVDTDRDLLRRLAYSDVAPDISRYIIDQTVSEDIRKLFLQIACNGKLAECVESALQVASLDRDRWLRYYAVELVCDCGTDDQRVRLAKIVSHYRMTPEYLCGIICRRLFPKYIDVNGLISLIQQVEPIHEKASNHLPDQLKELFLHATPEEFIPPLLAELLILAQEQPRISFENKELLISSRYFWLYEPLQALAQRLLQIAELDEPVSNDIVRALILFRHFKKCQPFRSRNDDELDLHTVSEAHPRIRRAYVWQCIAEFKARKKAIGAYLWRIFEYGDGDSTLKPSAVDQEWLLQDIRTLPLEDAKIAMELATVLWSSLDRPVAFRAKLKQTSRRAAELSAIFSKNTPNKLKLSYYRFRYRTRFDLQQKINKRLRKVLNAWYGLHNRWWYLRHLNELRTGKAVGVLHDMYWHARDHEPSADHEYGSSRWQTLVLRFGDKIAQAVREGWKASWRVFTPPYPFERDNSSSIDGRITLGQIGIKTAITDGLDIASLPPDDARILVRYALWETNDNFQQWLTPQVKRYPDIVKDALEKCIEAEWHVSAERPYFYGTLYQLENSLSCLQQLILPKTMALLEDSDPSHKDVLKQALSLLFASNGKYSNELARLAAHRIKNYHQTNVYFLIWLVAWLNLNAAGALDFLESLSSSEPNNADALFVSVCNALSRDTGNRMPCLGDPSYKRANNLMRLIPLCYKHIRPEEDIDRSLGGVYTPTARDGAQDFRGSLLGSLAESKEPHAFQKLQTLLDNPLLESRKDYILHLLDEKAETDAEPAAWRAQDVAMFMAKHEASPRSTDDLFRIALKRFAAIQDSVEHADFSQRRDLRAGDPEETLQVWLARELENRANEIYSVVREPEVDRKKKPDIRLVTVGLDPVTIEVKWAHDWSYKELEEALHKQLVGQYMKANSSRHGILAIATYDAKRQWHPPGAPMIDFRQLLETLKKQANTVLKSRADIDGLEIVGIDFN